MLTASMIYLTQLIFIKEGKEATFLEFESFALPLMQQYNGHLLYRIRPPKEAFVDASNEELPYEIHIISFDSEADFTAFMKDDSRLQFLHLKEESVKTSMIIKGKKL